jgi:hypothetical protein
MPARCHVDDNELVRNLLLGQRNADPTRIRRQWMIVQLDSHGMFLKIRRSFAQLPNNGRGIVLGESTKSD